MSLTNHLKSFYYYYGDDDYYLYDNKMSLFPPVLTAGPKKLLSLLNLEF